MISSVSTSISYDSLIRPDIAGQSAAPELEKETVLPPSNTVQQNQASSGSTAQDENSSSPLISLSTELVTALQGEEGEVQKTAVERPPQKQPDAPSDQNETSASGLTDTEEAQVDSLKERDQEVRTHEQAHANTGGQYAGSPSYEYETGPDGQQYAVGGEVQIDTAPISGDPAATIAKMETVIKAALAPADPSSQDKAVAAAASQKKIEAQADLNALKQAERSGGETEDTIKPVPQADSSETSTDTGFVNPASEGNSDTIISLIA